MNKALLYAYYILIFLYYLFFITSKLNIISIANVYLKDVTYYLKIFVALCLFYYFNPYKNRNKKSA